MLSKVLKHINKLNKTEKRIRSFASLMNEQKDVLMLSDNISLIEIMDDEKTIFTKNFALVQTIKLSGVDYSGISSAEYELLFRSRKALFDTLPNDVEICFYYLRKKIFTDFNQKKFLGFPNQYAEEINVKWQKNFRDAYKTEIYLAIRKKTPLEFNRLRKRQDINTSMSLHVDSLSDIVTSIIKKLRNYKPEVLRGGELANFWGYLMNCEDHNTSFEKKDIGNSIALTDIAFDRKERIIELNSGKGTKYAKILSIKSMPTKTRGDILNNLMTQRHEFVVYQQVKLIEKEKAKSKLKKLSAGAASLVENEKFIAPRIEEIQEAGELVESNEISFSEYSFNTLVLADSKKELLNAVANIETALSQSKIKTLQEGLGIGVSFWSMFPDYFHKSGKVIRPTTHNLSDLITLGASHEGIDKCSFGSEPVTLFKTTTHTNYSFTFHRSAKPHDNGNTLIIGGTGLGKTTLIEFLLMNCLKYPKFKLLNFDSQNGMRIFSQTMGGSYISAGEDKEVQLNPMLLPENQMNKTFLVEWIESLAGGATEQEKEIINIAVNRSFELKKEDRYLSIVRSLAAKTELATRLEKWLPSNEDSSKSEHVFGMLFNARKNSLNFDSPIVSFDMHNILELEEVLGSLSSFIFHSFKNYIWANPSPHALFIDEMGRYIDNKRFKGQIKYAFQEIRKKNGIVIGAVQQPTSIIESEIGSSIISNTATFLIFPNPSANQSEYMQTGENKVNLGLNDSEFDWVLNSPPEDRKVMLKRQGGQSVILNVDLKCLGEHLGLFSSNNDDVHLLEKLMRKKDFNFVDEYLKMRSNKIN